MSKSPSQFNIVSTPADTVMGRLNCTPILSLEVSVKKIKWAAEKKQKKTKKRNGDVDSLSKTKSYGLFTYNDI